jgi:hypothetical protein
VTPAERKIFWSAATVCALSRFASRAQTLWDWDEALFCLGMRSFDVSQHHPHPPGFPAYIMLGRIVRGVLGDDFRSLQTLNLIAGMLLFPAVYLLARSIGARFPTAIIAGVLCVFFPNVWFYGGTAFSDVTSITMVVFAAALLFRSAGVAGPPESRWRYFLGVLLLAFAMAIRPQNALVGIFPLLIASRRRKVGDIAIAAVIGVLVVGGAFADAANATGLERYREAVRAHSEYISRVDSYRNPLRPPLWRLTASFFAKQYSSPLLSVITTLFVVVAIAGAIRRRDRVLLYNALTFGPVAIAALLFLDRYTVPRFSIGYIPMFAIFAADGIHRVSASRPRLEAGLAAALTLGFIAYSLPQFTRVRREVAPSVAAVQAAKSHFDARQDELYVAADMRPFVDYFMPGVPYMNVLDERALPLSSVGKTQHLIAELLPTNPEGFVFRRKKGNLWNISRRHYYGAAYATMTRFANFESGWYPGERSVPDEWRWLAQSSTAVLPGSQGESLLRIGLFAGAPVTISLNGKLLDTLPAGGYVQREWHISQPDATSNRLDIATDRDRAVRVRYLSWATY